MVYLSQVLLTFSFQDPEKASILSLVEPASASILESLVLSEEFTMDKITDNLLILTSAYIAVSKR